MEYEIRFKPKSLKDGKKIPKNDLDYEDLKLLRQAKCEEAHSPTIPLEKAKYILLSQPSSGRAKTRR